MDARVRLGQLFTGILAALLVVTSAPLTVASGGPSADVGDYVRDGAVADLTDEHLQVESQTIVVEAPAGASEVRVDAAYLQERLGDFAADRPFRTASGSVVVASNEVTFTTFAPGPDEVFTLGSDDSLRFLDRPMWVSVRPIERGIAITAEDGDTSGQRVHLDRSWLVKYGVATPLVVHEDGTVLEVTQTATGEAFVVDVPHFSGLNVIDPDLDLSWQTEGFTIYYSAEGPNGPFDFQITVAEVTQDRIKFRIWYSEEGVKVGHYDEKFDRATRESVVLAQNFSYDFVTQINIDDLNAKLGPRLFDLSSVTTSSYVFTNTESNLTYYYDLDQGWLRKIEESSTGHGMSAYATGTGVEYPTQDLPLYPTTVILTTPPGLQIEARFDDFSSTPTSDSFVGVNSWSGGDSNEEVKGNFLGEETNLIVTADYYALAEIATWSPSDEELYEKVPCFKRSSPDGCHVKANSGSGAIEFRVRVSRGTGDSNLDQSVLVHCSGGDCAYNVAQDLYEWDTEGTWTLNVEVEHDLWTVAMADFWLCGMIDHFNGSPSPDTRIRQERNCDSQNWIRSGVIQVDSTLPI